MNTNERQRLIENLSRRISGLSIFTRDGRTVVQMRGEHDEEDPSLGETMRHSFESVSRLWRTLHGPIREAWEDYAEQSGRAGYTAFMAANVKRYRAGTPLELCPGAGEQALANIDARPGAAPGEIRLSFSPALPDGRHLVIVMLSRHTMDGTSRPIIRDCGCTPQSPVSIQGLAPGVGYHLYALVTGGPYGEARSISPAVAMGITMPR